MKIIDIETEPFHQLVYRSSGRAGVERKLTLPFYRAKVDSMPEGIGAIVATSDLQGRELDRGSNRLVGEAVADELALLSELEEIPVIDIVLLAGDLYDYPDCRKLGGTGDVTSVWNSFCEKVEHVVGVHGNHDTVRAEDLADNALILDGQVRNVSGIHIGGVSGIVGRADRNQRKSGAEYKRALDKATANKVGLLLLHQGPDDPANAQIGDPTIREHLERKGSSIVIFGHCHWSVPFVEIGGNQVLNVDNRLYVFSK